VPKTFERPYGEVRDIILTRAKHRRNPCDNTVFETVQGIMERLTSVARDPWAAAFSAAAEPFAARAQDAETRGDAKAASAAWRMAYGFYRVARYPAPNSAGKTLAYKKSQEAYVNMESYAPVKLQIVRIPFTGKPGEGSEIRAYLRLPQLPGPHAADRHPVVMIWGGIDSFKEERRIERYVKSGFAALSIDMPGVGEAPLAGSTDAERMWDPIFDWIATRPELDAKRVAVVGCSTGGYWATKLAHTHKDRLAAAINHGGSASIPSNWRRRWPAPSAAPPSTNGSITRRNCRCSTWVCSINLARRCFASTASTTRSFPSPTIICCWNMARRNRRGSSPVAIWATATAGT